MNSVNIIKIQFLAITILLFGNYIKAMDQTVTPTEASSKEDEKALFDAACSNDVVTIEKLLTKGVNPNTQDNNGTTALMFAAGKGHTKIVKILFDKGANPNTQNNDGDTALHFTDNPYLVEILLDNGANPNTQNNDGDTALIVADNPYLVEILLDNGANPNTQNNDGNTALIVADNPYLVEILLDNGANPNTQNNDGDTALILAADNGHTDIAKILLDNGANPNIANKGGYTALMIAAHKGHTEIVKVLQHSEPSSKQSEAALFRAVYHNDVVAIKKLLTKGVNPNITTKDGDTALILAADKGHTDTVEILLKNGANPNTQNNDGNTALVLALDKDDQRTANLLFEALIKINSNIKIPQKSCLLTFTRREEDNGTMRHSIADALATKNVVICSACMLYDVATKFNLSNYFIGRKLSLFVNLSRDLCVIIPEKIESAEQMFQKYGFMNLDYIEPEKTMQTITEFESSPNDKADTLIQHFKDIIDESSPNHPTRFCLDGHGSEGFIADIRIEDIKQLLTVFTDIDTQFLLINSCCTAGQNLIGMQKGLENVINNQLKENLRKQIDYEKSKSNNSVSPEKIKGINYSIAVKATSDTATTGEGNLNAFFETLSKYLEPNRRPKVSINAVFQALGVKHQTVLPSIRFPGTTTFFRSVDLGDMEIITWAKLQSLRLEKRLKPILLKKLNKVESKTVPSQAEIVIPIKSGTQYVQIFPRNLIDCSFVIQDNIMPKFISKIPGQSQHFIGKITYKSQKTDFDGALDDFTTNGFMNIFEGEKGLSTKCWFIKSLELVVDGISHNVNRLVINIDPQDEPACIYYDGTGYNYKSPTTTDKLTQKTFASTIQKWFVDSKASDNALYEATGGNEGNENVLGAFN